MDPLERFMRKVQKSDGCWLWTASGNGHGYGQFRHNGTTRAAHRVAYELMIGPIPSGLHIDHLCRVRLCVNPAHLEAVTQRENNCRADAGKYWAAKTHCPRGHEYSPGNTAVLRSGSRICKVCRRARSQAANWESRGIPRRTK
jgi:HNH endonuclease